MKLTSGETITDELAVANAHPAGASPFGRADYIGKFTALTEGIVDPPESARFLDLVQDLANLDASGVQALNVQLDPAQVFPSKVTPDGIF